MMRFGVDLREAELPTPTFSIHLAPFLDVQDELRGGGVAISLRHLVRKLQIAICNINLEYL